MFSIRLAQGRICPSITRLSKIHTNAIQYKAGPALFHYCRFLSTQPNLPKSESKPRTLRDDFPRLMRLAKPEFGNLSGALLCLIATSTVSMSLPYFIGKIIDTTKEEEDEEKEEKEGEPLILGLPPTQFYSGLVILFVCGSIANFGRIYLLRSVGEKMVARLRSRLFAKVLSQDSYFFDVGPTQKGMKTGDLISRLSSDTQIISKSLSGNISDGARSLISGCVGLSMMCWVSWKLTLCMSLIFPPLILMSTVYGRRIKKLSRTIQDSLGSMTKVSEEKFNGLKTIQSFAQQKAVVHEYNHEVKDIFNKSMLEGKLSGVYYSVNGFLGNITLIGLLVVGSRLITAGEITIGDLSSFMMYAVYTGSSVFGLGNFYTELMKGIGAAERIFELIESKPKITTSLGRKVDNLHGDIEFRNVNFAYPSRENVKIFDNLNLTIKKDENVCFVGPSGSGKSTVSQLLLRFYDPLSGEIRVNDNNIKELNLNFYRSNIGYVQQEPLLFSGTIRENITFGKPDSTDEEIVYASKLSNAYNFINAFPNKFDTIIGPSSSGSAQLSGGQKQRISLARTLIKNPKLLILDEATSALDSRSEETVTKNLTDLCKNNQVTIISIAHRLSTIKNSERIIVLNTRGHIVEDGKFENLLEDPNSKLNRLLKSDEFSETDA
ncbi:putative ATP-dependent permease [Clavispora lusitaniae]|uniref:ATP-dependent permease n=1 Tax=Clavispora lusitaniae TaxID=36911 RepID=A0ACD0WIJ0_CLALS|nr:putative ATP-dependent permease [Clavispora lusitaniae]QFZ33563.1 putative ATP-dependent permease [Clavispora lusitaniae]QFZ39234.1 putative ATP-dependent permease [Clavispora lusitaniae]QFZ44916.1 putative ATP-dependent permease [Clavispora lusitaniae]QFZ50593.1 putative ATP-dependent permease [Clavispora lusitaniae]